MGIWDNVKSRLGMGGGYADRQNYDAGYDDGAYDDYENDGAYDEEADDDAYDRRSASMKSYGVDRADYYNDNHAPLVTQADVRSQPLPVTPEAGQVRDRIPAPRAYRRTTNNLAQPTYTEDAFAFKGGLARTPGSFAQLQSERLRMEDTGKMTVVDGAAIATTAPRTAAGLGQGGEIVGTITRSEQSNGPDSARGMGQNPVRARVHRRIEHLRPKTYADAEQVAQELRRGAVVILDLRVTRPELAKRILDFSFGVASALEGQVDRHIDRVYVFSRNGMLTDEERATIRL
jgi:cell division inhibitor SepF